MKRRRLFWRGRKHVALSFQLPTLTDVVTHLAARVALARREFRVVGVEFNTDTKRRTRQAAHVRNLHRAHDDSLYRFQVWRIELQKRRARLFAQIRREEIERFRALPTRFVSATV